VTGAQALPHLPPSVTCATTAVVDVGGTYVRRGLWSPGSGLRDVDVVRSPSLRQNPGEPVTRLRALLVKLIAEAVPPGLAAGVSVGAALDHRDGVVLASAPLWGDDDTPFDLLGALRRGRPDVTWTVLNDVTAALVHLMQSPPAQSCRKIMVVTVSTGVACRVVDRRSGTMPLDGRGLQGEIGHLPVTLVEDGVPLVLRCDCGRPGHLAAYASGPGIRGTAQALALRRPRDWQDSPLRAGLDDPDRFDTAFTAALGAGDPCAGQLLAVVTRPIADVLRTALCLDPEIDLIALTGGVATGLAQPYLSAVRGHLTDQGLYLTDSLQAGWSAGHLTLPAAGGVDPLIGAGLAAAGAGLVPGRAGPPDALVDPEGASSAEVTA